MTFYVLPLTWVLYRQTVGVAVGSPGHHSPAVSLRLPGDALPLRLHVPPPEAHHPTPQEPARKGKAEEVARKPAAESAVLRPFRSEAAVRAGAHAGCCCWRLRDLHTGLLPREWTTELMLGTRYPAQTICDC